MKIKVQIDSVFQEETLQIQTPSRTPKIQQVVKFVESLDNNHRLKGKKDGETYLIEPNTCLLYTSDAADDQRNV